MCDQRTIWKELHANDGGLNEVEKQGCVISGLWQALVATKNNRKAANHNQDPTQLSASHQVLCLSQSQRGSRKTAPRNPSPDRPAQKRETHLLNMPLQRSRL
jgi:hypothetical protein